MAITRREEIPVQLKEYEAMIFIVNILSHKWSLFVLLSLMEPKRFNQLRRELDVSHSVLAKELKDMEQNQLINRRIIENTNPPSVEYSLTSYGKELLMICMAMEGLGMKLHDQLGPEYSR